MAAKKLVRGLLADKYALFVTQGEMEGGSTVEPRLGRAADHTITSNHCGQRRVVIIIIVAIIIIVGNDVLLGLYCQQYA